MSEESAKDQADKNGKEPDKKELKEEKPVIRDHKVGKLAYTTEVGRMPIYDDEGNIDALMFYTAYRVKDGKKDRPLIFSFNGGPGSPSLWLHLGALGPKRVRMQREGGMPQPPYEIVDNPHSWLEFADVVFIDPIGTGFSRAKDKESSKKYWGLKGDIESVGQFIRLFLTRNERFSSPLFLAGESYGTTRASGLAGHLADRGITFNGLILVSSIMNFQTARFVKGNDLPYALFLPTYTATAHYHGKVKGDLQKAINEAREFAQNEYWLAMMQGDELEGKRRTKAIKTLSRLTGLSEKYLDLCDLRPVIHDFCKELLRDDRRTVGRLDSRFQGIDDFSHGAHQRGEHDPSMSMLMGPYTALYCDYIRGELGYETDLEYEIFRGIKEPWDWGSAGEGHPDTSEALRKAMARNPYMQVYVASGYYDLATPFFATEYTISHLGLDPSLRDNIRVGEYEAGHMMYIHEDCLKQLGDDIEKFVKDAVTKS